MGFYEQIAPYYDLIFPAGREQLHFIRDAAGLPPGRLLDIACGAGTYSVSLAQEGYEVWATDLDAEMIRQTESRARKEAVTVNARVLDMLELNKLGAEQFDCVFCIGNSIVHLGRLVAIKSAVLQMKNRLKKTGCLLLQIINFDRIISKGISSLPAVIDRDAGVEFYRNYSRNAAAGLISFETILKINQKDKSETLENSVLLFPLLSGDLSEILKSAGFGKVEFYGGFGLESYQPEESYLLVVNARV